MSRDTITSLRDERDELAEKLAARTRTLRNVQRARRREREQRAVELAACSKQHSDDRAQLELLRARLAEESCPNPDAHIALVVSVIEDAPPRIRDLFRRRRPAPEVQTLPVPDGGAPRDLSRW